ncbi:NmrA family NAD(P)-binding protein [Dactylosporangium sp. CS-033363]|uniref:NAD-dependent epimerase/dehydratase family protein n=1 Tax=Dactylosporangium sp. CS-033363 TaxID=3239935 RepID=UPI003D8C1991
MILVTGATGTVGRHLVAALEAGGHKVRGVSRSTGGSAEEVLREGGVDALFLHPRAVGERAGELAALARECGVRRIVALSAMNVDDPDEHQPSRLAGDRNREAEQAAAGSGLPWVALRASSFAANTVRAFGGQLRGGDVVRYTFRGFEESLLDERDLGEVAAAALLGAGDGVLELTGPQSLSHGEQVAIIGAVLGRPLRFEEVPPEAAARGMVAGGMPAAFAEALMARYRRHLDRPQHPPTDGVRAILGRPACTFAHYVEAHRASF